MPHTTRDTKLLLKRIRFLWRSSFFIYFTIFGNLMIILGALFFHYLEFGINPELHSLLDSFAWVVGLVTTVGNSPVFPVSIAGKWLSIFLMLGGSLFLWSYMGLIVSALISPELALIEKEVRHLETDMDQLQTLGSNKTKTSDHLK